MFANAENALHADIIQRIASHANSRPRALQTAIGCSSVGTVCDRKLGYMMLNTPKFRARDTSGWMATIGTAVHTYLETVFQALSTDYYMTETPVTVKHKDVEIPGTVDLYNKQFRTVVDFKVVGTTSLNNARRGRISRQYAVQVQLYALGLQQAGYKVDKVAILFLPRNGELSESVYWETTYDPQMAQLAIDRLRNISIAVKHAGVTALEDLAVEDGPCTWCDYFNPAATELAKGCPGKPLPTTPLIV